LSFGGGESVSHHGAATGHLDTYRHQQSPLTPYHGMVALAPLLGSTGNGAAPMASGNNSNTPTPHMAADMFVGPQGQQEQEQQQQQPQPQPQPQPQQEQATAAGGIPGAMAEAAQADGFMPWQPATYELEGGPAGYYSGGEGRGADEHEADIGGRVSEGGGIY